MNIDVFTDGACIHNGTQQAQAGYGVYYAHQELPDISKKYISISITNQRAELYAIYKALRQMNKKLCLDNTHVNIYTDSQYSINCMTKWIKKWKKNNWQTSNKEDVKNKDIIEKIDKKIEKIKKKNCILTFTHVHSHTGKTDFISVGNDKADKLAVAGMYKI